MNTPTSSSFSCPPVDTSSTGLKKSDEPCPVCLSPEAKPFGCWDQRHYLRCHHCQATFLAPSCLPDRDMEKKLYDLHQNQIDDPGYLRFLSRLATPLLDTLPSARRILDYGCGPTPALASLLTQAGHHVTVYDPFYFPSTRPLQARYQAITCSEVAEHFHHPFDEFAFLDTLLEEGGWLGVMTCFQTEDQRFGQWHYRRDPTHVCFYRRETFEVIAFQRDWQCHFPAKNIALMFKPYS